jgi:hypothetical protein
MWRILECFPRGMAESRWRLLVRVEDVAVGLVQPGLVLEE